MSLIASLYVFKTYYNFNNDFQKLKQCKIRLQNLAS